MTQLRRITATDEHVRMGPLALFTLVTVLCLAVLAVLAVSTANATLALSQRRAEATTQLYLDETAAQTFLAALAEGAAGQPAAADATDPTDDPALAAAIDAATTATGGQVDVSATRDGDTISASFDCGNNRELDIALSLQADGSVLVDRWRMTTVVNEEPAMGDLFGSDSFDSDPFAMDPFAMP